MTPRQTTSTPQQEQLRQQWQNQPQQPTQQQQQQDQLQQSTPPRNQNQPQPFTPQEQQEAMANEQLRHQWHQTQKQEVIDTQLGNAGRQQSQQPPNNQGCMEWNSPFARVDNKSGMPQLPEMRSINTAQS